MIRAKAMLWKPPTVKEAVHDGDTYWMIVDIKNNGYRAGAIVCDIRLWGYSAREVGQGPELDAAGKVVRVSGNEARDIAKQLLSVFNDMIEVEFMGRDKYGRDLGKIFVAGDEFGPILAERKAASAGAFKGVAFEDER